MFRSLIFVAVFASVALAQNMNSNSKVVQTITFPSQVCFNPGEVVSIGSTISNNQNGQSDQKTAPTNFSSTSEVSPAGGSVTPSSECPAFVVVNDGQTFSCTYSYAFPEEKLYVSTYTSIFSIRQNGNSPNPTTFTQTDTHFAWRTPYIEVINVTSPTCFEGTDGQFQFQINGAAFIGDYTYTVGTVSGTVAPSTPVTFSNVGSGVYEISAVPTNANFVSCSIASSSVTLTDPAQVTFVLSAKVEPSCDAAGSITVTASGAASFCFTKNGGDTWECPEGDAAWLEYTYTGIAAGDHVFNVRSVGDSCLGAPETVTFAAPAGVSFLLSAKVEVTCEALGSITVTASGAASFCFTNNGGSTWECPSGDNTWLEYTYTNITAGDYVFNVRSVGGNCLGTNQTETFDAPNCGPDPLCARSQGYYSTHQNLWVQQCDSNVCALWCGQTFNWYLNARARGNAVIVAGKQFAAFVLNFWYYNSGVNIRTYTDAAEFPTNFPTEWAEAFLFLNSPNSCSASKQELVAAAGLLELFNSHNTTAYPWLTECPGAPTAPVVTPVKKVAAPVPVIAKKATLLELKKVVSK